MRRKIGSICAEDSASRSGRTEVEREGRSSTYEIYMNSDILLCDGQSNVDTYFPCGPLVAMHISCGLNDQVGFHSLVYILRK